MPKIKIINDPVHGFIRIPRDILQGLIDHPYFQRLRRIKQLGMTHLVYPGALHTRFHHALGSYHLLHMALEVLKQKDISLGDEECESASVAVLLHDIGHGPFSHALEKSLVNAHHETLSLLFMERLNEEYKGRFSEAIAMFRGQHPKKFLTQLVSSQLDVDRLDYLRRDSFYTGVSEGVIGSDRIIQMMQVKDNRLVIEEKGIYSIEKFLLARRLMYWQVYLHKTVVAAEYLLIQILKRAKELTQHGRELWATPTLSFFLRNPDITEYQFRQNPQVLDTFALLDDYDIMIAIKVWMKDNDPVLARLCYNMVNRQLYRIAFMEQPAADERLSALRQKVAETYGISEEEAGYFAFAGMVENSTYSSESIQINILMKDDRVLDIGNVSDQYELPTLSKKVVKYFICYPKELREN